MRVLLFPSLALLGAAACRAAPPEAPLPEAEPPRAWRLLERDGLLVLEPAEDEGRTLIELRFSKAEAATSDVVEAEIRLPGNVGRRRLSVRPGRPGVRILGTSELTIDGAGPARVRFTCDSAGPGGIVVNVRD